MMASQKNEGKATMGPEYRPAAEKPTAAVSKELGYANVHVLPQTPQLIALLTYA